MTQLLIAIVNGWGQWLVLDVSSKRFVSVHELRLVVAAEEREGIDGR